MPISRNSARVVRPTRPFPFARLLAAAALPVLAACGDSTTEPPLVPQTAQITVNAAAAPAYVRLGTTASTVTVTDPATSSAWDLELFATTVTVNGGAAGPAGAMVTCLCQNASATNTDVAAMTPASQLPTFEGVVASAIPGDASFASDQLSPAISGWYSAAGAGAAVVSNRSWIVRKGTTTVLLAKFHVVSVTGATTANPGSVTFEYAIQSAPGGAFGAPQTATVDTRTGAVYYDLSAGAIATAAGWDLRFDGYDIRLNGGVSGSGSLMAVLDNSTPFAQIDAPYAATAPVQAYRKDAFSGAFATAPWYRYNITGTDNQIWPTYNVYLVKRGSEVYKLQLTGYYGTDGSPRQVTLRYARLR